MTNKLPFFASFIATSLLYMASTYAATIAAVISPTAFVIAQGNTRAVVTLPGTPVYYCGAKAYNTWALRLIGQPVSGTPSTGLTVPVDGKPVAVSSLLVSSGWLQPTYLDDDAQAAITEGRGGWACAMAQVPFDLMHATVDPKVLAGIALNESGNHGRAWPWTLNVAGTGEFFRSREDAFLAIRSLLASGRCDFDVGIMQVNWCYHHQRFDSPWDALAPQTNIHVAESILNENYQKTGSVAKAIAYYHSANPGPGQAYLARFAQHLSQIEHGL